MNVTQARWIRWIGIITMVIDHIGYYFFPEVVLFRIIGRIAMPCFVYGVVWGVVYTRDAQKYAKRLAIMGGLSILAWGRLFPINVGFTLALIVLGLTALRKRNYTGVFLYGLLSVFVEYSIYGYFLSILMYSWQQGKINNRKALWWAVLLHVAYVFYPLGELVQLYGLLFIVVYIVTRKLKQEPPKMPRWFGYGFYPAHVLVLRMISIGFGG